MRFIVASTPSDAHTWNLVYLQLLLEEYGHEVINLGSCAPVELVVERCRMERPDHLLISSVNGHGFQDGLLLAAAVRREASLRNMGLIVGGKLNTRDSDHISMRRALLDAGCDHVFQGENAAASFRVLLEGFEELPSFFPALLPAPAFAGAAL